LIRATKVQGQERALHSRGLYITLKGGDELGVRDVFGFANYGTED
jgi:hypothetical protein